MTAVERIVRRARLRLDAVRLAQFGARGALAASVVALLFFRAEPWWVVGAGALAGVTVALARRRVTAAEAALFLDDRWGTKERIVTLLTRPASPFAARLADEIELARPLPRVPFPREVAGVPAALLLVFAVGLLPSARADQSERVADPAKNAAREERTAMSAAAPEPDEATRKQLANGTAPADESARATLQQSVARLRRPEDRRAARDLLKRAFAGDAEAARKLGWMLDAEHGRGKTSGGAGDGEENGDGRTAPAPPRSTDSERFVRRVTCYPDQLDFLREFRRAKAEEK